MRVQEPSKPAPWWRSPRVPAAIAVGVLHLALAAALVLSLQSHAPSPLPREVFFLFRPAPQPARLPRRIEPAPLARAATPFVRVAPPMAITLPPPATTPLEVSLFRCAPENLAKLTAAERAHCDETYFVRAFVAPIPGSVNAHARDAARWQIALDQRNASAPCTSTTRTGGPGESAVVVDPLCVLRQLSNAPDE
jgi:hypothetical protein